MANTLEYLANQNEENYSTYLKRMRNSCSTSSKQMIPFYTFGCKTILDVGCADGSLMKIIKEINPEARVIGIDLNPKAVEIARSHQLEVYCIGLEEVKEKLKIEFDCVIFSSVLHEFSSYAEPTAKYTSIPIENALKNANALLANGGTLIIRDGLEAQMPTSCRVNFLTRKDFGWFKRFVRDFPYIQGRDKFGSYVVLNDHEIKCSIKLIQEFFATWTWGAESWHREINEKFCILSENAWTKVVKEANFDIISFAKSKEEYPKFITTKVWVFNDKNEEIFPYMTCTIVAKAKKY